jgi:putative hydrolase of the HAD superfamily
MGDAMRADGIRGSTPAGAPRAVLLDALGTLVELPPPWPPLVQELAARGVAVGLREARAAMRTEMAFYRAEHHRANDRAGLAALRADCTAVLREALGPAVRGLPADELQAALLASLRFRPYPEVPGVLHALRAAGAKLVVVSNWDVSLHGVLAGTGLRPLLDAVVTSAELGAAKPDPAIFAAALRAAGGVPASEALHVGDDEEADAAGARAAGIPAVLVRRHAAPAPAPVGLRTVRSLAELVPGAPPEAL